MSVLEDLADRTRPLSFAGERTLPLSPALEPLFPVPGLRRGSTVIVMTSPGASGQGATSLAAALAAEASTAGSWCAAVGFPDLGLAAVAELGVALEHLALVPQAPPAQWVTVVGALLDAVDVVIVRPPAHLRQGDARRLTARARERGAVLMPVLSCSDRAAPHRVWADGVEVRLSITTCRWTGPGAGEGRLLGRHLEVTAGGRGAAARSRVVGLWLPAPGGGIAAADATPASLRSVG